jgi:hypothetical protein
MAGAGGGSATIAARSAAHRSTGRSPPSSRNGRVAARSGSHALICAVKSSGEVNVRPGRNEVSKKPLRRSTSPLTPAGSVCPELRV